MVMIVDHLNTTLSKIESFVANNNFNGSLDEFYDVIEAFSLYRPVR